MSYTISPKMVTKVEQYLAQLINADAGTSTHLAAIDANKLAYNLRQGVESAFQLKIEPYDKLKGKFKFCVHQNRVVCENIDLPSPKSSLYVRKMEATIASCLKFPEVASLLSILPIIVDQKEAKLMEFPNFMPDDMELHRLSNLCGNYHLTCELMLPSGVRLTRVAA